MADEPARQGRRRRPLRIAVAVLLLMLLAIGAALVVRVTLATWIVDRALDDTPFQNASFHLASLDPDQVVIEDLVLDYPFAARVARMTIDFDIFDVVEGRVASVTIGGLAATVTPESLEALPGSSGDGAMPITIDHVTLHDGDVLLSLDGQEVQLNLTGELTGLDPPAGTFQVQASGPQFALSGPIDIMAGENGLLAATWQIDDGRLETPDASLTGLAGEVLIERPVDPDATLAVNVALSSDSLHLDGHDLDHLHIELAGLIGMPAALTSASAQAVVEIGTSDSPTHGRIAASLDQFGDVPRLTMDVDIDLNDGLRLGDGLDVSLAAPSTWSSHVVADLPDMSMLASVDPLSLALAHLVDLTAQFRTAGIDAGGRFAAASAEGDVRIGLNGGDATATMGAPIAVTGLTFDPEWLAALGVPQEIAALLALPSDVKLSGDTPWRLARENDGAGWFDGGATFDLARSDISANVTLDGAVTVLPDGTLASAILRNGRITAAAESLVGAEGLRIEGDGRAAYDGSVLETQTAVTATAKSIHFGTAEFGGVEVSLPFDATLSNEMLDATLEPVALVSAKSGRFGDLTSGPVEIELPLRVAAMRTSLMVYLDDNGWIDLAGLEHPSFTVTEPVSLRINQSTLPLLAIELSDDGDMVWDARVQFAPPAVALAILDADGSPAAHISGTLPGGSIHATRLIENYLTATVETQDGSLRWDEQDIEVSGLRTLVTHNTGLSPWPQMRLDVAAIRDLASPARFAPLSADLRVTPVWPAGDDVRLSLNVHAPEKRYALNVEASYEEASNQAVALVRLPPLVFEPGVYQPKDLSPISAAYAKDVSGSVEVSGEITWRDGVFASDLDVAVRDLSATAFGTRMERMNTLIKFDNVMPLSTPPGQLVAIAGIDAGLPMRDALISLALDPDGIVVLESAEMKFAGGEVTSDRASWRIGSDPEPLLLQVTGVDVGALFALADMAELTASGTLDGTIPVRFADGDVIIEDASLASRVPGELHYLPDGTPAGLGSDEASLDLVLDALSNFHYERLEVDLDRAAGGETEIGLHIAGANPDLYDGYPIELNVSLTGALDQIVRDSLAGYRVPDEIRERLSGF